MVSFLIKPNGTILGCVSYWRPEGASTCEDLLLLVWDGDKIVTTDFIGLLSSSFSDVPIYTYLFTCKCVICIVLFNSNILERFPVYFFSLCFHFCFLVNTVTVRLRVVFHGIRAFDPYQWLLLNLVHLFHRLLQVMCLLCVDTLFYNLHLTSHGG